MAIVLIVVGAIIAAVGGFLYWGNMSGSFITFPYAGYITIGIGGAIGAYGYRKMHEDKQKASQQQGAPGGPMP